MTRSQDLVILKNDYERLISLVGIIQSETSELLEDELNRANIVEKDELPPGIVTMNSIVTFSDESANKELTIKLVYPNDVNQKDDIQRISVFAPVGAALIGLRVGGCIDWPLPNGKIKKLRVLSVKEIL
ncbi:MAG: nucleoside diphosphate kinase regulator [Bdellovibrionales bacterium]|nr:nucleoside diphosphate kinase regulator [Bdellovibrionales bacterium]